MFAQEWILIKPEVLFLRSRSYAGSSTDSFKHWPSIKLGGPLWLLDIVTLWLNRNQATSQL
jgi:hypothetical protein